VEPGTTWSKCCNATHICQHQVSAFGTIGGQSPQTYVKADCSQIKSISSWLPGRHVKMLQQSSSLAAASVRVGSVVLAYIQTQGLPRIAMEQCNVSLVNQLLAPKPSTCHHTLAKTLATLFLPTLATVTTELIYTQQPRRLVG